MVLRSGENVVPLQYFSHPLTFNAKLGGTTKDLPSVVCLLVWLCINWCEKLFYERPRAFYSPSLRLWCICFVDLRIMRIFAASQYYSYETITTNVIDCATAHGMWQR